MAFSTHCQGYRQNKLKELKLDRRHISEDEEVIVDDAQIPKELVPLNQDREVSPGEVVEDFHDRLFDFIPQDTSTWVQDLEVEGKYNVCSVSSLQTLTSSCRGDPGRRGGRHTSGRRYLSCCSKNLVHQRNAP